MSVTSDPHQSWKGGNASGGTVNPGRAMFAAAALHLMTTEKLSVAQAMKRLGVAPEARGPLEAAMAALKRS